MKTICLNKFIFFKLDEDDMDMFEKAMQLADGKIIVDGQFLLQVISKFNYQVKL